MVGGTERQAIRYFPPHENEKTYQEFVDEISPDDLYRGLLAFGLFSEKLPPLFTAEPFYDYCISSTPSWGSKKARHVEYESFRNNDRPRRIGIPSPFAYQQQCVVLRENWRELQDHFARTTNGHLHRTSRIHLRKMVGKDSLFEMNYKSRRSDGYPVADMAIGNRYLVETDISNCFPGIYTHCIAWALKSKEEAKEHQGDLDWWPNKIDVATQNTTNGETHGLLIGPHSSNLVSELILTRVDQALWDKGYQYIRHIDDYDYFAVDRVQADQFLIDLRRELREYGLDLNHSKTRITELPKGFVENWVRRVNGIGITSSKKKFVRHADVSALLDVAVEETLRNNNDAAPIKYVLKKLLPCKLRSSSSSLVQQQMMHLAAIYPYLVPLMDELVFEPWVNDFEPIAKWVNNIFPLFMNERRHEAAAFLIYYSLKYEFRIDSINSLAVIESADPVLGLLAYLYMKKHGMSSHWKAVRKHAAELAKTEDSMDFNWVLTYVAAPADALPAQWKSIRTRKVRFLRPEWQQMADLR